MTTIRDATLADLPAILDIANQAIAESTAIWHLVPDTLPARTAWFEARRAAGYPVLVADHAGAVAGFASYGPFRPFAGYDATVEHSIYVNPDFKRLGLGRALLEGLVAQATAAGKHVMIGAIEAGNAASIALHARLGFVETGRMPQVGRKFDRWLDLVLMQRMLG